MKRFFRVFVPILLSAAVLISIGWYLIQYDPDFTRDMLVSYARDLDDQGNHRFAAWFYQLAYRQSGNDEDVALELAEQYRSMGNFTKAEYTLSNAIADGGSLKLYIALCSVYVQQDKLLDAVNMLDNVADPDIKAQLDTLRPEAPVPNHEPGYFNQYISLSFTVPEGKIYVTSDGSYPSTSQAEHTDAFPIPAGETVIHGLTVGENGLVSPLSILNYTITGVIEEVVIEDAAIEEALRNQLQVTADHTLYTNELWTIADFSVPTNAKSLSDLSKLSYLQRLTIIDTSVDSLAGISTISTLEELVISGISLTDEDLQAIASLPKLKSLTMVQCRLSGISALSSADTLTYLNLSGNTVRDLTALETMKDLTELHINHNALEDLSSLSGLSKLEVLDVSFNSITQTAPLTGCTALKKLNLSNNSLTDLSGLEQLTALEQLSIAFTGTTDVSLLSANTALTNLDISNNSITDITGLNTLTNLQFFNFSYNQVTKLPQFSKNTPLVTIKGSRNQLTSLKELSGMQTLNYVIMDFNEKLSSVQPLVNCYALVELSVYGTKVREVSELTKMGVIVKYSPI